MCGVAERTALFVLEPCSAALDGGVEETRVGVVYDTDDGVACHGQAERDADVRVQVHEVCGAVDGVDDEGGRLRDYGGGWCAWGVGVGVI